MSTGQADVVSVVDSGHAEKDQALLLVDTTCGSWLHRIAARFRVRSTLKIYIVGVLLTYIPLAIAAAFSPAPLLLSSGTVRLPFLRDWNIAFALIVAWPTLLVFTIMDQAVLTGALRRIQRDGILVTVPSRARRIGVIWARRFRIVNYFAYGAGILTGLIVAYYNYVAYRSDDVGYWIASQGRLHASGYIFLYSMFLLFAIIPVYSVRSIATSLFLRHVVKRSQLHMLPFHPDNCGGLRPIGRLGLRNQYLLTVFGVNVALLVTISQSYLNIPTSLYGLIASAAIAYLILGPLVFMGPLLSFRTGMIRAKAELMSDVARRLRVELRRLRASLPDGEISREDHELIERLRKIGSVVDELPVWPFDASTLRRFLTAYVAPLLGAVAYPLIQAILKTALGWGKSVP
jgi:hypothetical protein